MQGRPLCAASAIFVGILFLWYILSESPIESGRWEGQIRVSCQVEQIQGIGEKRSLVVCDVIQDGQTYCQRMKVYGPAGQSIFRDIKIGHIISIAGTASSFSIPGNPGQFNEYKYYTEQGIQCKCFAKTLTIEENTVNARAQWLYELRTAWYGLLSSCLPEKEAGIVAAMLLGEKSGLTEEVKELYQRNGIAHILAISGVHISLLGVGLFYILRQILPMRAAAVVTMFFLVLYGELTGFSVSTQRAVCMMFCMLFARVLGRKYDRLSALSLSAMLQLAFCPGLLFESGFLLSYGTVLGICVFVDELKDAVSVRQKFLKAFLGSFGVFLVTLPILLYFYYEWNPFSALLNMLILPFVSIVIAMAVLGSGLSVFFLDGGRFLFGTVHAVLQYYEFLCQFIEKLPCHSVITGQPKLWQIFLYYLLMGFFCLLSGKGRNKYRLCLIVAAFSLLLLPHSSSFGLNITNLDVGQGDCAVIRVDGRVMLIDGGSSDVEQVGKYRIVPYLKYYGIQKIDFVFITHSDSDHTNGILEILQDNGHMGLDIGAVAIPDIQKRDAVYEVLERKIKKAGIPVIKMKRGSAVCFCNTVLKCLHPLPDYDWKTENDYSLVLQLEYGKFRGLFTGDLERDGEQEIICRCSDMDYLKVGHHGSKSSSSEEFLQRILPDIAVLSAGKNNRYGHPSGEVLERLAKVGANPYCTIEAGAVNIWSDGNKTAVECYRGN